MRNGIEKRIYPRITLKKSVRALIRGQEYEGTLANISARGAAVIAFTDLKPGENVELFIADISTISGQTIRVGNDSFAVSFLLDQKEEDRLIARVMELQNFS